MRHRIRPLSAVVGSLLWFAGQGASAQPIPLRDSFDLGAGGAGLLCTVQATASDKALADMFDRAYAITCRDAAVPVGALYALKGRVGDPARRLAALRESKATCRPPRAETIENLGAVEALACTLDGADVGYNVYLWRRGRDVYAAEGLAGYDSALRLGLRTIALGRIVPGEISVATTGAGDPAAFARVQAGTLDPQRARIEAYRRNNAGSYAESAEYFDRLLAGGDAATQAEATLNQALQQSNLGYYAEADSLFARARPVAAGDPVLARMARNYRAIDLMNRVQPTEARAELDRPMPAGPSSDASVGALEIDAPTAARLNAETALSRRLAATAAPLTIAEKAEVLDDQAEFLRAILLHIDGKAAEASALIDTALVRLIAIREGRLISTVWLRAQMLSERAGIAEEAGDRAGAETRHKAAVALLAAYYPGSAALLSAEGRLAAYYSRTGQTAPALALYRQIVDAEAAGGQPSSALAETFAPYFALLARQAANPGAVADMFKASQLLVRPGVAQTQAVLARELSGGSDAASGLFRQSVTLTRDIERSRVEMARLAAAARPTPADAARLAELGPKLAQLERDQAATQAKLAAFPRYRVVSGGAMSLADLQTVLRDGEAYYKMLMVGDAGYAIFVTPGAARAFALGMTAPEIERRVDAIRATISTEENGRAVTYPFDVEGAHALYGALFGSLGDALAPVRHLIFESDGAMLRLPPNLLVAGQAGIDAYRAKARRPGDDGFDFTDIDWLGRDRDVSTAVSARAFRDVRAEARSAAAHDYIGFGENVPPSGAIRTEAEVRGLMGQGDGCAWSMAEWARPISSAELRLASAIVGGGADAPVVTGAAFTDTAIKDRADLSQYRILHFATHGLVTAPRPECPARPALMTSFGAGDSDGLLTFAEIFDLRIDADLVILSACDTAGKASVAATREAGVSGGGGFALDGLVRAFVGAGGRAVIASHWPVPDDYDATRILISGLFTAPRGTPVGTALRQAEDKLMSAPATSHPYYWAGFAIVGDGAAPVIPKG